MPDAFRIVKDKIDIAEHVATYIDLDRRGVNSFAPCPFHSEDDPSFCVNSSIQKYHCFGCGADGDIFDWEMEYNGLSAFEAIQALANQYNIEVDIRKERSDVVAYRNRFMEFVDTAHAQVDMVAPYLHGRGISDDAIREWKLGGIKIDDDIVRLLGISREYIEAGEAVVLPVCTRSGEPVRVFLRILEPVNGFAKYVGSAKDLPNYQFSLFGAQFCRRSNQSPIIVEGQLDAVLIKQAGFSAISLHGSSLTDDHIRFLSRLNLSCGILDGDDAGFRFIKQLAMSDLYFPVLQTPQDTDPASILADAGETDRKQIVRKWVRDARHPVLHYLINGVDTSTVDGRLRLYERAKTDLNGLSTAKLKEVSIHIARKLDEDPDVIYDGIAHDVKLVDFAKEEQLLYSMLYDSKAYQNCIALSPSMFGITSIRNTFKLFQLFSIQNRPWSTQALIDFVNSEKTDNMHFPVRDHGRVWENILQDLTDLASRRHLYRICDGAKKDVTSGVGVPDVRQRISNSLSDFAETSKVRRDNPAESMLRVVKIVNERMTSESAIIGELLNPERWGPLNDVWLGIQVGKYHVVSGDNGAGKSAIVTGWALDIGANNTPITIISSEMNEDDIRMRLAAIHSGLGETYIKTGDLNRLEYKIFQEAALEVAKMPLYVVYSAPTVDSWIANIDFYYHHLNCKHFVIDYLQQAVGPGTLYERVTDATSRLQERTYNKERPIGLIVVSQQNREGGRQELPDRHDIGGSYKVAQDADRVLIASVKKEKRIKKDGMQYGNRWFKNDKNRGGVDGNLWNGYLENCQFGIPGTLRSGIVPDTGMDWVVEWDKE